MADWLNLVAAAWLDLTLAAALMSGVVALAMIQCRQPARRRVWGRLGLAASLAIIPLVELNPLPRIDLSRPPALWGVPPWNHNAAGPTGGRRSDSEPAPALGVVRSALLLVAPGLILAYGAGLAFSLGRLGLGWIGTRLLIVRSEEASAATEALLRSLPFDRPERSRPTVRVSARLRRPVLVGLVRPRILIPPALDEPGAEQWLRLGLLHELAHAEFQDQRFDFLANLTHAVWFFLPPVGWIRHQLRLDAEFLADHRAVGSFGTTYGYAASLLGLAERVAPNWAEPAARSASDSAARGSEPSASPPAATRRGRLASALFQRVQMLLKCPFEVEDRVPRAWSWGVAGVVLALMLLASSVSLRPARLLDQPTPAATSDELGRRSLDLAALAIAPQRPEDPPFDLRFHLPSQFTLTCEVLADPTELQALAILGHHLAASVSPLPGIQAASWHRVEVVRDADGGETLQVDGNRLDLGPRTNPPAATLTIRPIPNRLTSLRDLHLSW